MKRLIKFYYRFKKPLGKIVLFVRALCGRAKGSEYSFSLNDRFYGAKLFVYGYKNIYQQQQTPIDDDLCKVDIGNYSMVAPSKAFKPGELTYIYHETFDPWPQNPHAYQTDFIKIVPGDVVIDAGACEGMFTDKALKEGAYSVYMFEPTKMLGIGLQKTFEQQIDQKQVFLVDKALSDKSETLKFNIDKEFICMAQLDADGPDSIEAVSIDDFVTTYKLPKLNFIKADIEGAEVAMIKGAEKTIKTFKPKLSIAVYHHHQNANKIAKMLKDFVPEYKIVFGGCYMFEVPYRPFMLYAFLN